MQPALMARPARRVPLERPVQRATEVHEAPRVTRVLTVRRVQRVKQVHRVLTARPDPRVQLVRLALPDPRVPPVLQAQMELTVVEHVNADSSVGLETPDQAAELCSTLHRQHSVPDQLAEAAANTWRWHPRDGTAVPEIRSGLGQMTPVFELRPQAKGSVTAL